MIRHEYAQLDNRYLLVTVCNCSALDDEGNRFFDPLWAKDLAIHRQYISDLTVAAPLMSGSPPAHFVRWDSYCQNEVRFIDLPYLDSLGAAIRAIPRFVSLLNTAIKNAEIVHSGIAGWPLADGWFSIPLARMHDRFTLVVVESDFWRVANRSVSWKTHIRAFFSEKLNLLCVNLVNLAFFTHQKYKESLLYGPQERGHVIEASWIDAGFVLSDLEAKAKWQKQTRETLRLAFVGRLIPEKGLQLLLESLSFVLNFNGEICIDIVGEGPLISYKDTWQSPSDRIKVRFLGTLQYGSRFFSFLDGYDALLAPSISNEQPRIVFDAFARALPVLGFNTDGLISCVINGRTGLLCEAKDCKSLAALLEWATFNRKRLAEMGLAALSVARSHTHALMHKRRSEIIARSFQSWKQKRSRS